MKVLCVAAQGVLLTVCAVSFAVLSSWEREEDSVRSAADTAETTPPMEEPLPQQLATEVIEETVVPSSTEAEPSQPVVIEICKADLRGSLDARIAQLARHTSMWREGSAHYEDLLEGTVAWDVPYVLVRFDEMAALYFEALKAAAPKAQSARLNAVKATVEAERVTLEMTVGFEVTNKVLGLMLGDKEQVVTVVAAVRRSGDGFVLDSFDVTGNKRISDSTVRLGSDFLFGTDDYKGFVGDITARTTAALGKIYEVSDARYGVVFETVQ